MGLSRRQQSPWHGVWEGGQAASEQTRGKGVCRNAGPPQAGKPAPLALPTRAAATPEPPPSSLSSGSQCHKQRQLRRLYYAGPPLLRHHPAFDSRWPSGPTRRLSIRPGRWVIPAQWTPIKHHHSVLRVYFIFIYDLQHSPTLRRAFFAWQTVQWGV